MKQTAYYHQRINKALDFINKNLNEEIKIEALAQASHFSTFHFHRIYKSLLGETPYESLHRLRLEKAVFLLKFRPKLKIAEVAFESGFPSIENFSRQFKSRFGISPSHFKKNKSLHNSRIYQEQHPEDFYHCIEENRDDGQHAYFVSLEELDAIPIAFVRGIFGSDGSGLVEKYLALIKWAEKKEINYQGELTRFGMSIDNPDVTPASKYRYDFALKINKQFKPEDVIEIGEIPKALYATIHCKGNITEVAKAWDYLYKSWLPNSNCVPIHYPAIEEFIQGPEEIGWENFNLKCRIPIMELDVV